MCVVAFGLLALGGRGASAQQDRVVGATSQLMAAGKAHAVFIQSGFDATSWGTNTSGELGHGNTTSTKVPVSYTGPAPRQVAAGDSFTVAIDQYGQLWAVGKSDKGQTGLGAKSSPLTTPTQFNTGGSTYTVVAAGTSHGAAISTGGLLTTWGDNSKGEIGNGSTASVITSASVGNPLTDRWIAISLGNTFSVALKNDGSAWAWGHDSSGQLGINSTTDKNTPQAITSSTPWTAISAGDSHVLGIKADGTLWAWGLNDKSQIGISSLATTALQKTPAQITSPSGTWIAVSAGGHDSFALKADGTLWAWGDNGDGQLGISNGNAAVKVPTQVGAGFQFVKAGYDFTIGVTADGNVFTWGHGSGDQLGNGGTANTTVPGTAILYAVKPGAVMGGASHGAELRTSGVLTTFGSVGSGALGLTSAQIAGCTSSTACAQPVAVTSTKAWRAVATGESQTLGIKSDGTLWAWGANYAGEVGNGHTTPQTTPVQIGTDASWLKVFAGPTSGSSFGIKADGTLWAWGQNGSLQLGTSASGNKTTPTAVSGGKRWISVSTGGSHTLGLTADGKLWAWGDNDFGQLGVDYSVVEQQATPRQITSPSITWLAVSAGYGVSSAISDDNHLYSWGLNDNGEIGDGTFNWQNAPEQNLSLTGVVSICRDSLSALAVNVGGTIFGWGGNYNGEIGSGDTNTYPYPIYSSFNDNPQIYVGCGGSTSYEIDNQSFVYTVGYNQDGEEGTGYVSQGDLYPISHDDPDGIAPEDIDPSGWSATASVNSASAGNIFLSSSWTTGGAQTNQWIQIDMTETQTFSEIYLNAGNATNYPRAFKVQTSTNGTTWSSTLVTGTGTGQYSTVTFPATSARYIRITETATSTTPWNVASIIVLF